MSARNVLLDRLLTAVLLTANAVVVNAAASRHLRWRADLTEGKENTLSQATLNSIERLPDRARIRAFVTKELPPEAAPTIQPVIDLISQIERVSRGRVAVDWLDPNKYEVVSEAKKLGIRPYEGQLTRADNTVQFSLYFGLELRCADRPPRVIPFMDLRNPEYELARAFAYLAGEKTVAFLTREPPAPPKFPGIEMPTSPERIFDGLRERLRALYSVTDLGNTKFGDPIPEEVDVLVLGRPTDLTERERFEIDQFLMRGGRVLVLYDAHQYDLAGGSVAHKAIATGLQPLLGKWGIQIPDDVLVADRNYETVRVPKKSAGGMSYTNFPCLYFPSISRLSGGLSTNHPITKILQAASLYWISPIDVSPAKPNSITVETLLQSSELGFRTREVDNVSFDDPNLQARRVWEKRVSNDLSRQRLAVALVGKFPSLFAGKAVPAPSESRPSHMPKLAVEDAARAVVPESMETRIVVFGDSDFATNSFFGQSSQVLLENAVEWLALDQDLTSIRGRGQVRRIRNLEVEAAKGMGKAGEAKIAASNPSDVKAAEIVKYFEDQERVSLEARDAAERTRTWIKFGNVLGPGFALVLIGILRLWFRGRERARYAAKA